MFPTWNINLILRTYITQESCLNSLLVQLPASVIDKYQPTSKTRGYFHFKQVLADDIAICYCGECVTAQSEFPKKSCWHFCSHYKRIIPIKCSSVLGKQTY